MQGQVTKQHTSRKSMKQNVFVNNKLSLIKPKYYFLFATTPLYMYNIQTVEPWYSETLANNKVVDTAKFFTPVRAKCKKENLDITKPHFIKHIL